MIHKIIIPKLAANMEKGTIGKWLKKEGEKIEKGESLFELSTDKAIFEVEAEKSGFLRKILVQEGEEASILSSVGVIAGRNEELPPLEELKKPSLEKEKAGFSLKEEKPKVCPVDFSADTKKETIRISPRARKLAEEKNIDFGLIKGTGPAGRITEKDVRDHISSSKERILIIGGGKGAQVVIDILSYDCNRVTVGILDDNQELWGKEIRGVKILGPIKMVDELKDKFDFLIIAFSKNMDARREIFLNCKRKGYKFINVVHPKALIENNVELGEGNLIYALVRIGPYSKVGNNNLISAFTNIEHHNEIGSHILFGPHCSTSGTVNIGDGCKLGTGIFVQDNITIGNNALIASGSIIINDISSNSVLRRKIIQKPESRKR